MNRSREELTIELDAVSCNCCDTQMEWSDEFREWICPQCGNLAFQDETCGVDELYFEHSPDDDYEEYYGEEEEDE